MKGLRCLPIPLVTIVLVLHSMVPGEAVSYPEEKRYSLKMPNARPMKQDLILCVAFLAPSNSTDYIVAFEPTIPLDSTNHVVLYGCETPGQGGPGYIWDCTPEGGPTSDNYPSAPTCATGSRLFYTWTKEASPLTLPPGVGFKIGKGTGINYLVLAVYYEQVSNILNGGSDDSGLIINVVPGTANRITKKAGIFLPKPLGVIRARTAEKFEAACAIDEPVQMHPFAFRPHAHALGITVSGYKVDKDGNWILIGKGTPRRPMSFFPVKNTSIVIENGDIIASRCTMYNFRDRDTYIGATIHDEMCRFYMMYYVEGDQPLLSTGGCESSGPPTYYWSRDPRLSVPPLVDVEASDPKTGSY